MPVITITPPATPYDTVDMVLNKGRVRMNDAIQSIGGDILQDSQPFTQEMAIMAWRRLQSFLAELGYSRLKKPLVLPGIPVVANLDPASQCQLTWSYFFDGTSFFTEPAFNSVLPQDFILPLRVWERMSGTQSRFCPMEMAVDYLPDYSKGGANCFWFWENDTLYLPGSLYVMDLRLEYAAFLPDFATIGLVQWFNQPVPIMRCMDALAWYFCAEAAGPRNDMDADGFILKAESAARKEFNKEVSMKQRRPVSRRTCSGRGDRGGYGYGRGY